MLVHAKKRHTKEVFIMKVEIDYAKRTEAVKAVEKLGGHWTPVLEDDSIPAQEVTGMRNPGHILAGFRYREGLTQKELAAKTGISQHRISEFENNKRQISKNTAKILAAALSTNYKNLL